MVALENACSSWLLRSRKINLLLMLVEAYANTSWAALNVSRTDTEKHTTHRRLKHSSADQGCEKVGSRCVSRSRSHPVFPVAHTRDD